MRNPTLRRSREPLAFSPLHRGVALLLLMLLAVGLASFDLHTRLAYRLNIYPILVTLAVFVFEELGLLAIAGSLLLYHFVSLEHHFESHVMLVSNIGQLFVNSLVGVLSLLVIRFYKERLQHESRTAQSRRDTIDYLIHEIRNPLFAARGLLYAAGQAPEAKPEIATARAQLESIEELLAQLHDAHSDDRTIKVQIVAAPIQDLLEEVARRFSEADGRHQYQVEGTAARAVLCDPKLLGRILDNLLGNALRYAQPGKVTIRVEERDDQCQVSVQDEGPGLSSAESQYIFERHRRGEAGLKGQPGLGIGLYLSRRLAQSMGGALVAHPGPRGLFQLTLPSASPTP